jgi:hypothetical protein
LKEGLEIEIFNEWMVGMHYFIMHAYSDITLSKTMQYELGWVIIAFFIIMFAVNIGYVIVGISKRCRMKLVKARNIKA